MPPPLEGKSVRLRALTTDDVAFAVAFANDEDLRAYLRFDRPMSEATERAWIEALDDERDCVWLMEDAATGASVGLIGLHDLHWVARHAELGLGILRAQDRGRGVGAEAIRLVLAYAFDDLGLRRVHLRVLDDNPAKRLYERLGFRHEGTLRAHMFKRGAPHDLHLYGLFAEEWAR